MFKSVDELRRQTREADDIGRIGKIRGPLHGIPLTIKDDSLERRGRIERG